MKRLVSLIVCGLAAFTAFAQDFSNKGKDFWVGYGSHVSMYTNTGVPNAAGGGQDMVLYFTSDQNATVTVAIPATGWTRSYTVIANQVKESDVIPKSGLDDARLTTEGVSSKAIHVTSTNNVVAYAHIYNSSVSGASLLFPTNTLGREYYSLNFDQKSNSLFSYPFFFAIATDTGTTTIEITPTANTQTMVAGTTYTFNLQQGQIINVLGAIVGNNGVDLSGSVIKSVSTGSNGCKPIAVFSGSGKIYINCSFGSGATSADNYMVQSFPKNAWGKRYLTVPTKDMPYNYYRVMVSDATSVVTLNGVPLTGLIGGRYYQFQNTTPNYIESDKPIMVAQYITTQLTCGNPSSVGDPEMIYLSAIEQTINNITFNSTFHAAITKQYFNAVIKTSAVNSFKFDGTSYAGSFVPHPSLAGYSYAQLSGLTAGSHTAISDSGFNAIAYGYGQAESYGYNAGTNIKDLLQHIVIKNQYATIDFPATCVNTPFTFAITLPYQATSLKWDFHGAFPNITNNNPVPDSSYSVDGKTVYLYRLPTNYSYNAAGTYPISVLATNPTPEGCSGINTIDYDVEVFEKPKADWSFLHSGCLTDSVKFIDSSKTNGRSIIKWNWDFGDLSTDSVKNPSKLYNAGGVYPVKLRIITDVGCLTDTTKIFNISAPPVPKFGKSALNCPQADINFTDSSTISTGSLVKWYWDFGNGRKDTLTDNSPRVVKFATAGTYFVKLVVESNTGCKSYAFVDTLIVHEIPVADFTPPALVCIPDSGRFINLSSIMDGTAASFKFLWDFDGTGTDTTKNPVHYFTVARVYNVSLKVTSTWGCSGTKAATFTNYTKPVADFTAPADICFKDSARFVSTSTGQNQTLNNWSWSFGNGLVNNGSNQSPSVFYITPGSYKVNLVVASTEGCKSDTATKTVVVNAIPVTAFINSTPVCATKQVLFTNQSTTATGNITRWYWTLGDGRVIDTTNGNPFNQTYAAAGPYTVKLYVTTDKGCKGDTLSKNITINAQPTAAFILPEVCLSDAFAQFTDSSFIADGTAAGFTYSWNFGDPNANAGNPNSSTIRDARHRYSASGNYTVTLIVTSVNGCISTLVKQLTVNGDKPVSSFNILTAGALCSNLKVEIQNKSTVNFGSITKTEIFWDWVNNPGVKDVDDVPATDKIYSHLYPNFQSPLTKTIQIRLLAYSGGVCVDDSIRTITLSASPKVKFTTTPGICLEATPLIIAQASETGGVPGTFTFSGPGVAPNGLFNPAAAGVGTHTISYLYVSNAGCRDSATQTKTVWPRPVAKYAFSTPACEKTGVRLTDSSAPNFGKLTQWKWDFGDSTSVNNNSNATFSHYYSISGTYQAALTVVTDSGCTSIPFIKSIIVNPLPKPNFSLPAICLPPGAAQFNDSSTIADGTESQFTYAWRFGDGGTSVVKNPVHIFTSAGPFTVVLAITSGNGCTDTATKLLTEVYQQPKADFTVLPAFVCIGDILAFSDQTNPLNQSLTNWYWDFGDGSNNGTLQNLSHLYTRAGAYQVKLYTKSDKGCFSDTAIKTVNVYPYPVVNAGPDQVVLQGGQITLPATVSSASGYRYRWTPNTFLNNDSILNTTVVTPTNDITYTLTVVADGGCSDSDRVFVKLLLAPVIPNAFSPNKDGINDTWEIRYLDSYPGATIQIFDRYGRIVYTSVGYNKPFDGKLNGTDLPVGVYYYIVDPKNGLKPITGSITLLR
ncbi:MAG: PKD domain-containing protein [Chitinophagaceae bacterium]